MSDSASSTSRSSTSPASTSTSSTSPSSAIKAVLWDFGGVILSSPFDAFNEFEKTRGLPSDFIRTVNTHDPDANAWARLERSELTHEEFDHAFAEESTRLGHEVRGADVLALLAGKVRPEMVTALDKVIAAGYKTACLTNNVTKSEAIDPTANDRADVTEIMAKFEHVVESSKVGFRKPEPKFYTTACELLGVQPSECVYLDDLGINLKPAKAMGMTTIKVTGAEQAISELESILGIPLR